MTISWDAPVDAAAAIGLAILSVAVVLCAIRVARGPSLPDRIVALDTLATLLVGLLVAFGIAKGQPEPLRVATVLALVNFVGSVGFAIYIRRRARR